MKTTLKPIFERFSGNTAKAIKGVATDTAVHFGVGDTCVALATAEPFGIALNAGGAALAIGGRAYESITGKPSLGVGFYAASAVSAITTGSILWKGIERIGMQGLASADSLRNIVLPAAAFGFWTIANGLAGYRQAHPAAAQNTVADTKTSSLKNTLVTKAKDVFSNPQTYFCLGSAAVAKGNPVSVAMFMGALALALRKEKPGNFVPNTVAEFFDKHTTTKRLRAVAYGAATLMTAWSVAASNNPTMTGLFTAAYALFVTGNIFFDQEKNRTLAGDFKRVMAKPSPA